MGSALGAHQIIRPRAFPPARLTDDLTPDDGSMTPLAPDPHVVTRCQRSASPVA